MRVVGQWFCCSKKILRKNNLQIKRIVRRGAEMSKKVWRSFQTMPRQKFIDVRCLRKINDRKVFYPLTLHGSSQTFNQFSKLLWLTSWPSPVHLDFLVVFKSSTKSQEFSNFSEDYKKVQQSCTKQSLNLKFKSSDGSEPWQGTEILCWTKFDINKRKRSLKLSWVHHKV